MIYPHPESLKQSRSGRVLPQPGLMCPSRASGFVQRPIADIQGAGVGQHIN
ncbi:MAG: hypothetical protein JWL66_2087 [Sphingomonadales bacterium]|nr:hypothetical protein [Sphingomonadales bacterium]